METSTNPDARQTLERAAREHHAYLRRRLRALGVPAERLDDAAQDVLLVLTRRIDDYDDRYSVRQWMSGVARRVARRHRERAGRAPLPLAREPSGPASAADDPERYARLREAQVVLDDFLANLDRDRWAVFVRSELEGLRGVEIAAELDLNLNTVYARRRAALRAFDRAVARHHARARRPGLLGLLALPRASSRAAVGVGVSLTLAAALLLALAWALGRDVGGADA
ncbi:MAG: sigma-70 family RNA polymerase sigma factor, partial [Myxococcales bacterium]|nr:sigma-70 family RNA polymerase sigma factor [Myxococcales bacterium]